LTRAAKRSYPTDPLVVRSFVPLITNQRDADITIFDVRQHTFRCAVLLREVK